MQDSRVANVTGNLWYFSAQLKSCVRVTSSNTPALHQMKYARPT